MKGQAGQRLIYTTHGQTNEVMMAYPAMVRKPN